MKVVIGSLQCEGNSLTPVMTRHEDFDYAKGCDMYQKLQVVDYMKEQGCEIVPTIYAHALPGGSVIKEDFLRLADELVEAIPKDGIDGVWLYIHGAMYVEEIGSGDNTTAGDNAYMINRIKKHKAQNVLIAGIMDESACNSC